MALKHRNQHQYLSLVDEDWEKLVLLRRGEVAPWNGNASWKPLARVAVDGEEVKKNGRKTEKIDFGLLSVNERLEGCGSVFDSTTSTLLTKALLYLPKQSRLGRIQSLSVIL